MTALAAPRPPSPAFTSLTLAIVREIRPLLGLAYLEDDGGHEWTVTRSTEGLDLASVATGQQFELMIERFRGAAFVRACRSSS